MYFWNIDALKSTLRHDGLSQEKTFQYILASVILYIVLFELVFHLPATLTNEWTYFWSLADIIMVAVGTYWLYRANGGGAGVQFATRYFSVGFVAGIRFTVVLVFLVLPAIVGYESLLMNVELDMPVLVEENITLDDHQYLMVEPDEDLAEPTTLADVAIDLLMQIAYYAYAAKSIRDVARA